MKFLPDRGDIAWSYGLCGRRMISLMLQQERTILGGQKGIQIQNEHGPRELFEFL